MNKARETSQNEPTRVSHEYNLPCCVTTSRPYRANQTGRTHWTWTGHGAGDSAVATIGKPVIVVACVIASWDGTVVAIGRPVVVVVRGL